MAHLVSPRFILTQITFILGRTTDVQPCVVYYNKKMKNMKYRIAKKGETTTPRYEVPTASVTFWSTGEVGGTVQVFTRCHKGLEAAIELANSLETFVVAFNADCSTETVWTHPKIDALKAAEMLNYYK